MLANNFSTSTCFAIFELIKFMCFDSTLIYQQEEFLIPRPPRSKFNPHPPRTLTQSNAGSRSRPANAGTRNPCGLTRPAQDSISHTVAQNWILHVTNIERKQNTLSSPNCIVIHKSIKKWLVKQKHIAESMFAHGRHWQELNALTTFLTLFMLRMYTLPTHLFHHTEAILMRREYRIN